MARLIPSLLHALQFTIAIAILGAPAFLAALIAFWLILAPQLALGLRATHEQRGFPIDWLRRHTFPVSIVTALCTDVPLALLMTIHIVVGFFVVHPILHVMLELRRWLGECVVKCFATKASALIPSPAPSTKNPSTPMSMPAPSAPAAALKDEKEKSKGPAIDRYHNLESIWNVLSVNEDVRLVSLRWLMHLAASSGVLPRRQDLPEEAFINVWQLKEIVANAKASFDYGTLDAAMRKIGSGGGISSAFHVFRAFFRRKRNVDGLLPIVAVSYCWLGRAHPDPEGRQLQLMCDRLNQLYGGRGLLGAFTDYGFADVGVFLDWASLYQRDPTLWRDWMSNDGLQKLTDEELQRESPSSAQMVSERRAYEASRSPEQKLAFGRALTNTMDLWYGHAGTTVVLLTELAAGLDPSKHASYASRGWTTFERCSAELAKSYQLKVAKWKLVIDVADERGGAERRLPTTPEQMAELLRTRNFTNGADKEAVQELYTGMASAVLGTLESLSFTGLPLTTGGVERVSSVKGGDGAALPAQLAGALLYCTALRELHLDGTQLNDEALASLASQLTSGALPRLEKLGLNGNRFGARGIDALCTAFGSGVAPSLRVISLENGCFGDEGTQVIGEALVSGRLPPALQSLVLTGNSIGDVGAMALAAAIRRSGTACRVVMFKNAIGLEGQAALLTALEAKHGLAMDHLLAVSLLNPPTWPVTLVKAMGEGARLYDESSLGAVARTDGSGRKKTGSGRRSKAFHSHENDSHENELNEI